jgi:hypothetical protein
MIKPLLLISALLIVSNSAISQPEPKQTNMDPENAPQSEKVEKSEDAELVCTKERKTGSHLYTKTCRTKAQIEADRASGVDFLNRLKSTPQGSSGDGAG